MNEIQIFNNPEFGDIRTVMINGEAWFVGKDVSEKLGYQNGSRDIQRHCDVEDRSDITIFDGNQNRKMIVINESGLYSMIFGSKLETAKSFKHWVTSEILPSLRKSGTYSMSDRVDAATLKGAASAGCLVERTMKAEGARAHETAMVLDSLFKQSGIVLPDCFVKIPEYEQMVLPCIKEKE